MNKLGCRAFPIPPEFESFALTSCFFCKVQNPLETHYASDRITKCTILITNKNDLIEFQNSALSRVTRLESGKPSKIIMHHEYNPFRRFIVILMVDKKVYLYGYDDIEVINVWSEVEDVSSEDYVGSGRPQLVLRRSSGEAYRVSEEEFLFQQNFGSNESTKCDALNALNSKLKMSICLAESVEAERMFKERFISKKIAEISHQLQLKMEHMQVLKAGGDCVEGRPKFPAATCTASSSKDPCHDGPLRVTSTRQRLIHNKWVLSITLFNQSDRYLIQNPDLMLHSAQGLKRMHFTSRLLRSYQRVARNVSSLSDSQPDVTIEDLKPPVLRPKKKAILLAICNFPDFSTTETISCNGIITFQRRSTKMDKDESLIQGQVHLPSIYLSAKNLESVCVQVGRETGGVGISIEIFTLIAASVSHKIILTSIATPLDQVLESFRKDQRIVKISHLIDFYCFNTVHCPPLHLASFVYRPVTANKIRFTIYTRDDNQGMILINTLKDLLPVDAFFSGEEDKAVSTQLTQSGLLAKMKQTISHIQCAFEGTTEQAPAASKRPRKSSNALQSTSKELRTEWEEEEYLKWRRETRRLSMEMESLLRV